MEDTKIEIKEEEYQKIWKSCCLELDPEFTQFFIKYFILIGLMIFFGIELHLSEDCQDKNLFQSLLTLCMGIALPNPRLK